MLRTWNMTVSAATMTTPLWQTPKTRLFDARAGIYNYGILLLDDACFGSAGVNTVSRAPKCAFK